jgi:hypothetical protein
MKQLPKASRRLDQKMSRSRCTVGIPIQSRATLHASPRPAAKRTLSVPARPVFMSGIVDQRLDRGSFADIEGCPYRKPNRADIWDRIAHPSVL